MPAAWESPVLSRLTVSPAALAEEVAQDLGLTSEAFAELVTLYVVALDAAVSSGSSGLLVDQLTWQRTRLRVLAPALTSQQVVDAVQRRLAQELTAVDVTMLANRADEALLAVSAHGRGVDEPLSPMAQEFLERLLRGDRRGALTVVTDAVGRGVDVGDILLEVFEPVLIEIGRLWEQGHVSVAQEHFSTAVTQLAMSLLYPHLFEGRDTGHVVVAVGAGSEAHEVGLRIVTDLLERAGWRTAYLGTGLPAEEVVEELVGREADLLAMSATMPGQLRHVRRTIEAVRADPRCAGVRVVVGGRLFQLEPGLVEAVGADAWASDGSTVVQTCNDLVAGAHAHR